MNVAETPVAAFTVMTQVRLVPAQPPPDHPANDAPFFGVAVRVTAVPLGYDAAQRLIGEMAAQVLG